MTSVFIGGSRRLSRLNEQIRKRLAEIIARDMRVLIGDANGADRAVQLELAKWGYRNVVVYFVGAKPRNNEGGWPLEHIEVPSRARGAEFYAFKDREMARAAEAGLMLWDGESKGTFANVTNLIRANKPVSVYVSKKRVFKNVRSEEELALLAANGKWRSGPMQAKAQPELPLGDEDSLSASKIRRVNEDRPSRLLLLAREIASANPSFQAVRGPGAGDHATIAFMKNLRERARNEFGQDFSETRICGKTSFAADFYFPEEATIVEVALGLPNSACEFEKDVLKAIMAQDYGFSVSRLFFISRAGAEKKCSQPGRAAVQEWANSKHALQIEVHELGGEPRQRIRRSRRRAAE